jgi:hypothetical protein
MKLLNAWARSLGYETYSAWQDHCKANDALAAMGKAQKIDPSVTTEAEAIEALEGFAMKKAEKVAREIVADNEARAAAEAGAKDRKDA